MIIKAVTTNELILYIEMKILGILKLWGLYLGPRYHFPKMVIISQ